MIPRCRRSDRPVILSLAGEIGLALDHHRNREASRSLQDPLTSSSMVLDMSLLLPIGPGSSGPLWVILRHPLAQPPLFWVDTARLRCL
jgi:hypothetical protein